MAAFGEGWFEDGIGRKLGNRLSQAGVSLEVRRLPIVDTAPTAFEGGEKFGFSAAGDGMMLIELRWRVSNGFSGDPDS